MLAATDVDSAPYARAGDGRGELVEPHSRDARTGQFGAGNRFWRGRATSAGPAPKFADAESLWSACVKYFEWIEANPLQEMQLVTFQGCTTQVPVAKMRPMSISGLCLHLGIVPTTWRGWRSDRPDLALTIEQVESVIWGWQFAGAAADLLDAGMVIRQLGLANRTEQRGAHE
jgi:hypothetical protein